jgi:nucleoside-diphosphate-sugar epimerase
MKRAFVTGGSGFVGGAVIRELRARGVAVAALARGARSIAAVEALGASAVRGDLEDTAAMQAGMAGADVVIHAAAHVAEHGPLAEFLQVTVEGTQHALDAARAAGVPRFVHVSTEAVLADGAPIVRADETRPRPAAPAGPYPISKGLAEDRVRAANGPGFAAVIVRPRFIWGAGDTSLLPRIAELVRRGKFAWIDGGRYLSSTCHVANVVEGTLLAAERGAGGEIYFLTDGEPVEFRAFLSQLLETQGLAPPTRSIPRWLARAVAGLTGWMKQPPITRTAVALIGHEVTVVDAKARRELGYTSHVSRAQGLAELAAAR